MKILFAGSGEFGLPTLGALLDSSHEIVQVISQPDRPAGRGRKLTPTPIAQFAESKNLSILKTADINSEKLPPADLLVVIAFGQKISEAIVSHPTLGAINLHGSRLPRWRGAGPIQAAILAGDSLTGNSIIRVAPKMDAGDVLALSQIEIGELETAGELHDRLSADGAPLMLRTIDDLENGRAIETPQDISQVTIAKKLSRATAKIDWALSASQIANQIRGLYPWPGCQVDLIDTNDQPIARVTLVRARVASDRGASGEILASGTVATSNGAIEILDLQPQGKRGMSLAAFRNGYPWNVGMKLRSV